jgi:hypothetical protein
LGLTHADLSRNERDHPTCAYIADFNRTLPNRAIFLVNYRGYAGNPGTPSESAFIADAQAIFDALKPRYDQIAVMGRSLGTGMATAPATK